LYKDPELFILTFWALPWPPRLGSFKLAEKILDNIFHLLTKEEQMNFYIFLDG
jgi:hypothetical protein